MHKRLTIVVCLIAAVSLIGCESRTDRSEGGVVLSITDFDGLPIRVSVNDPATGDVVQIDSITLTSIPKDPNAPTSNLMNVEMESYQVTYTRIDGGNEVPPPLVQSIFGVTPVGGNNVYDNLPVMGIDQFDNPPLSNLFFENGGVDPETGNPYVRVRFQLRFFGETVTGEDVASNTVSFDIEFVP